MREQWRLAAEKYIETGNQKEAALAAGYSESYAEKKAWQLFQRQEVKDYIEELHEKMEQEAIAKPAEIMKYWTSVMRGEAESEVLVVEGSGGGSADPACLQNIQYMIRDGKLHCWVLFRSNDAVKASFMNMFALILLQKEFAERLGVEPGEYNHTANSYHCYPEDEETLKRYAKRIEEEVDMDLRYKDGNHCYILTEDHSALSYPYNGGWDALMEAEKPSIEEMVAEQRRKYITEKKSCANCGRECRMRQEENAAKQGCFDFKEKK